MYVYRRWVYGFLFERVKQYPRLLSVLERVNRAVSKAMSVVMVVGGIALAAFLGFVLYTFCSNLFGDLIAKRS